MEAIAAICKVPMIRNGNRRINIGNMVKNDSPNRECCGTGNDSHDQRNNKQEIGEIAAFCDRCTVKKIKHQNVRFCIAAEFEKYIFCQGIFYVMCSTEDNKKCDRYKQDGAVKSGTSIHVGTQ